MIISMQRLEAKKVLEKVKALKGKRGNWEDLWQDLSDFILPMKDDVRYIKMDGERQRVDILDSTAMTECELLAGALHGMLTSPSGYFFGFSTGNPVLDANDNVRIWLQAVVRLLHDALNKSNFQTEVHESYLDLCAIGMAPMSVEEDEDTIFRFSTRPIREIYVEENSKGIIDTLYRTFTLDARGLVDEFGLEVLDILPAKYTKAYRDGKEDKFEVVHAIYPKSKATKKKGPGHKWVSQYILDAEKIDLEVKGFMEFPYVVPRWSKKSGETYGRGPGEKALPEAKVLNKMTEVTLVGAQKVIDPPLQAPDDGFVLPLYTTPGGLNYYRAGSPDRVEAIFNDSRIDFGFQAIEAKQRQVRAAFYSDQLKLREGPQMTAREVEERTEQALRFLAPMLGRMQSEFLQPLVERIYGIMDRKGLIPAAPQELNGIPLKIQYISVVAMAQRSSELTSIQRFFQNIAPIAGADPQVFDNINADRSAKYIGRLVNLPQEFINSEEEVQGIRKQRAEAQAQAQQQANDALEAESQSKVLGSAAKFQSKAG